MFQTNLSSVQIRASRVSAKTPKIRTPRSRPFHQRVYSTSGVQEWDVVEYRVKNTSKDTRFGWISKIEEGCVFVDPLIEESSMLWIRDEDFTESVMLELDSILRVVESDYSQRMVEDRIKNPHGEHAEEIWKITTTTNTQQHKS